MQGTDDSCGGILNAPVTFSANESEDVAIKREKAANDSCTGLGVIPGAVLIIS